MKAEFITSANLPIPTFSVLDPDGVVSPGAEVEPLAEGLARKMYSDMLFTRVLDERMVAAQRQGRLSFYLTCTGEEAAVMGTAAAFSEHDMIMGQYREQAALRFRGFTTKQFMNQMFSNELDLGKGRQMPIHYGCRALNFMTISSPLGTQIPQAAGYAYGQKLEGKEACTLCYFGDGAASEGDFHAGLNMAAVLKCPVVFVARNNGYAISTPTSEQFAGDGIASRGVGYGIKTIRVDGNDILATYTAAVAARKMALANNEPVLIETMSYRLGAHSTSDDPSGYRSREEEDKWRDKDPINRMKNWLLAQGWWNEDEEKSTLEAFRSEVLATMKSEEKHPAPKLEELISDVYDVPPPQLQEQYNALKEHIKHYPEQYPATSGRL